nr:O-antigen polymerase [Salegentibacter sp. BDJ18]
MIFLILWGFLLVISFKRRNDLFSPLKIFLLNFLVFWGAIFYNDYSFKVYIYVLFVILFGFVIWYFEGSSLNLYYREKVFIRKRKMLWVKLWLLTIIPVFSQFYLINLFGGLEGYVASMTLRVKEWEGLGVWIVLIRSILVINLIYFILIVKLAKTTKSEKFFYILNFLIFVLVSLLTSSRSTLLVNIFLMFIIYYYYVRRINVRNLIIIGFCLLLIAMIMGTARNGYSFENGKFTTGLSQKNEIKFEASNFEYGIFPLTKITKVPAIKNHYYGLTYLSAISNLIPRKIWPEKPDTGGVLFTKDYHNVHNGYSNYSTGFIVEGIMNFGMLGGTLLAFFLLFFIYRWFFIYSLKKRVFYNLQSAVIYFIVYPVLLFLIPTFLHGEFTTVVHSIIIYKILLIVLFVKFVIPSKIPYTEFND